MTIPVFILFFFLRYPLKIGDEQDKHRKQALSESGSVHSPKGLFPSRIPPTEDWRRGRATGGPK